MTNLSNPRVPGGSVGRLPTKTNTAGEAVVNAVVSGVQAVYLTEIAINQYRSDDVATITASNDADIAGDANNKYARISVNGGNDVTDSNRLLAGTPNVLPLAMDESATITIEAAAISRIALGIVNGADTPPPAGCFLPGTTTSANLLDGTATESFYVFTPVSNCTKVEITFIKHGTNGGTFSVRGFA